MDSRKKGSLQECSWASDNSKIHRDQNRCWCASVYKLLLIPKQLRHNMSEHVLLRVMHFLLKRPFYLLSRENEEKLIKWNDKIKSAKLK